MSAAAQAMRALSPTVRNASIEAAANVMDGRDRFNFRRKQNEICRKYRRPRAGGVA